jgi:DNA-binding HxlR family transcriptional regulator
VPQRHRSKRRSGCPVSISLDLLGDRWSLLIVRDMMIRGFRRFKEFQESAEGIATNILADRLGRLEAAGIVSARPDENDARRLNYELTQKGIDLAPLLLELLIWGARHGNSEADSTAIEKMAGNRDRILSEVQRRWRERDTRPLQVNGRWVWS